MNSQTTTQEKKYINFIVVSILGLFVFNAFSELALADWEIDMSRRRKTMQQKSMNKPHQLRNADLGFVDKALHSSRAEKKEIVILSTKAGFIPNKVHLRKGEKYQINIVNVNKESKNTSFILDAFKEHHSTYYGQIKKFELKPEKEGIFEFQCPETSLEGRMIVYPTVEERNLASDKE